MELFDRPQGGERAVLVYMQLGSRQTSGSESDRANSGRQSAHFQDSEFRDLVISAGAVPVASISASSGRINPKYFIGTGKADEVRELVIAHQAQVVIIDHALTPGQERNLEKLRQCRVLDRAGLILDIFAQRARSYEGKLQVELAQLEHLATRLIRGWTHLERQRGGIGLRGPGETQLELDRRLIGNRIKQLKKRLMDVAKQRSGQRRARQRSAVPSVSLVGYTNAGKSTLFNRLTGSSVLAMDQLFATLDPTMRRISLPGAQSIVLADTVGFIRNLPHELVVAFRATLEETINADCLLHVIDAASSERHAQIEQVNQVLGEIGAQCVRQIEVYNKIDLLPDAAARIDRDEHGEIRRVWISAHSGAGIDALMEALAEFAHRNQFQSRDGTANPDSFLSPGVQRRHFRLNMDPSSARHKAFLHSLGVVTAETMLDQGGWEIDVLAFPADVEQWCLQFGCTIVQGPQTDSPQTHSKNGFSTVFPHIPTKDE